jgi:sugar O-acyltransferase (sialic acid O-acetyltransferase NeuD family)
VKRGYIVGAGAQGRIIVEVWRAQHRTISLHFLDDDAALRGCSVGGVPVVGGVDALGTLDLRDSAVVLGIGNNLRRLELAAVWGHGTVVWATVVHPSATVMPSATLGAGTVVFPQAVVNSGAQVGAHVIVNTGAIIEHDATVEDGCSLSPGVCMGGRVHIGRGAFLSAGVTIAPRVRIGAGSIVGAGATVVDDIPPGVLAYGVPARVIRTLADSVDFGRVL